MANQAGRNGVSQKNYYASYPSKAAANKAKRREKHLKNHPNDVKCLKEIPNSSEYNKAKPQEVSGWLTAGMDSQLTPRQVTPITTKTPSGNKETRIPDCACHLKDMNKADRKKFAEMYARVRKLHQHDASYGKPKSAK